MSQSEAPRAALFADVQEWAAVLLARLSPTEARRINRLIAIDIRRRQIARIRAQQNPDGSPYEPPRNPKRAGKALRGKRGTIRRRMFARLATVRYMRLRAFADGATIGYGGRAARIARVHQFGLVDSPGGRARAVRYAVRALLGFTATERARILDAYAQHLAR